MTETLVVAEHRDGAFRPVTLEAIGAANRLKETAGARTVVAVIAAQTDALVKAASVEGVDEVVAMQAPSNDFQPDFYEAAIAALIEQRSPAVVMLAHTVDAWSIAPVVAARTGCGFATDVFDVRFEDGAPVVTRAGYKEKVRMEIDFPGKQTVLLTMRSNVFPPAEGAADPAVSSAEAPQVEVRTTHEAWREPEYAGDVDIPGAEFIVSIGRGVGDENNVEQFLELAEQMGATLGCSRPVADAGWLPKARQVGQSGQLAASCRLYIALGISGAVQHQWGMKHVPTIVAINTDPEASIFSIAHYGIVGDIFEIAEELKNQF